MSHGETIELIVDLEESTYEALEALADSKGKDAWTLAAELLTELMEHIARIKIEREEAP